MKLKEARELGKECGLETDAEHVNNIFLHVMNLFPYEDIRNEEAELMADAKDVGVVFCKECGYAKMPDTEYCWGCDFKKEVNKISKRQS